MLQIVGAIVLATIPALIWGYIFYKKNPEDKGHLLLTFILGALAVFPILLYKFSWQFFPWLNAFKFADNYKEDIIGFSNVYALPLSVIITFMIVGVIEETMKFIVVRISDEKAIDDVDDSMEFAIVAALGFSFTENILYFYNIWITHGSDNMLIPFLFRSSFSTFAHIMFSGIFGYYYGIAHFASPILQEELRSKRHFWTRALHRIYNSRNVKLFHEEKLLEGFLIAVILHAVFNIFLEMNLTFLVVPFLVGGYITLNYLFSKKENHKNYGKLLAKERNHSQKSSLSPLPNA